MAVTEALSAIGAIADPVAREKAARDFQGGLTEAIAEPLTQAKAVRQQAVPELRQILTLAKVAEKIGLSVVGCALGQQFPSGGEVSGRIAGTQVTEVDDAGDRAVGDEGVGGVKIGVQPDRWACPGLRSDVSVE